MNMKKTKIIYSLRLCQFLLEHDCVLLEVIPNPFKVGFKAWRFENNQYLQECIALFMEVIEKDS